MWCRVTFLEINKKGGEKVTALPKNIPDFGDLSCEGKINFMLGRDKIGKSLISGSKSRRETRDFMRSLGPSPDDLMTQSEWDESMKVAIQAGVGKRLMKRLLDDKDDDD